MLLECRVGWKLNKNNIFLFRVLKTYKKGEKIKEKILFNHCELTDSFSSDIPSVSFVYVILDRDSNAAFLITNERHAETCYTIFKLPPIPISNILNIKSSLFFLSVSVNENRRC